MEDNPVTIDQKGQLVNIPAQKLRQGDLVVVQAGDIVPADIKLEEARALEVDEFEITGEILPVTKQADDTDATLYMGSTIIKGTGRGKVLAIGIETEYGSVLAQSWEKKEHTKIPLVKARYLFLVGLLLPALFIHLSLSNNAIGIIFGYCFLSIILILLQNDALFADWLIRKDLNDLKRDEIQIRYPHALSTLNRIDTICFDKTGVLTTRQIIVSNIYLAGEVYDPNQDLHLLNEDVIRKITTCCALCNDVLFFEKYDLANPVDKALINFAQSKGVNLSEALRQHKRIYDKPFDPENRYMASGFEAGDKNFVYFIKGAPEVILGMCKSYLTTDEHEDRLDARFRLFNNTAIEEISYKGNTAIALAYSTGVRDHPPSAYRFLCLLELENSLQPGARETIQELAQNGIRSIMVTGDRPETAARIAHVSGITKNPRVHLTGRVLERMSLGEVSRQLSYCSVFARLIPSQKGILIRLLQQKGNTVLMVGDGPNDGIALKAADVSISFVKNSSPIARRLSKILIHELYDLVRLIKAAHRCQRTARLIKLFRLMLIFVSLLGVYVWVFSAK